MPLDHVAIGQVADLQTSRTFYEKALKPLGYEVRMDFSPAAIGFGTSTYSVDFWVAGKKGDETPATQTVSASGHVAFKGTRAQVQAFHDAALQAGGKCNGPPGFRLNYHPFYYGAYVIDPDGNNIEVVNHGSGWQWFWYILGTQLGFVKVEKDHYAKQD
ncbi:Glyoxalase/Bleomycin resistance protein/Dihydroxybiphenyl dioxygenase [Ceratobasidium sp. AG-I]|nr:Glyoxalase/Bleomycin resistance protein/Dihydroxybiphenyl dioxygenase [Ceratobasidium sp. AG-I]